MYEGETGIIKNAEKYTKVDRCDREVEQLDDTTDNVAWRLVKEANLTGKNHVLVVDRHYNTYENIQVGMTMSNRNLYSKELYKKKLMTCRESNYVSQGNGFCMVWNYFISFHF